jgi:hypothetical protein
MQIYLGECKTDYFIIVMYLVEEREHFVQSSIYLDT